MCAGFTSILSVCYNKFPWSLVAFLVLIIIIKSEIKKIKRKIHSMLHNFWIYNLYTQKLNF